MRRSLLWLPLVLVGAVMYWSVALGLGGLSLALLSTFSATGITLAPHDDAIVVRLASPEEQRAISPPPRDRIGRTAY